MNLYIISDNNNAKAIRDIEQGLIGRGHEITYDWTTNDLEIRYHESGQIIISKERYNGIIKANLIIIIPPYGILSYSEAQLAIGSNKKILLADIKDMVIDIPFTIEHPLIEKLDVKKNKQLLDILAKKLEEYK